MASVVAVLAAGCHKQEPARTGDATPRQQTGDPMPLSPRGPELISQAETNSAIIPDTGDVNATLQQLTQALRDYVVRTHTVPKNFEEFASKSQVQFPAPPAGQNYAISGQTVVLVKR